MADITEFFSDKEVNALCRDAIKVAQRRSKKLVASETDYRIYRLIGVFLFQATANPDHYDSITQFNIENIGDSIRSSLANFVSTDGDEKTLLFVKVYRMAMEADLSFAADSPSELRDALYESKETIPFFDADFRFQLEYAGQQMVMQVVKRYLYHPDMVRLRDLTSSINRANTVFSEFDTELEKREKRADALKNVLDNHKHAFNFVGLHDGFRKLKEQKTGQARSNFYFLIALGLAMLFIPATKVIGWGGLSNTHDYEYYAALFGAEALLIFLFRVCLQSFKAVKAQLLQIDLRMTLCQFIQDYAKYAEEIRSKDKELLVQFERIVFSGIVNSEDSIPSTFDGIESIASVVAAIKKA